MVTDRAGSDWTSTTDCPRLGKTGLGSQSVARIGGCHLRSDAFIAIGWRIVQDGFMGMMYGWVWSIVHGIQKVLVISWGVTVVQVDYPPPPTVSIFSR